MRGALLVAGTSSDAGKSVLVAGICRWLRRQGVRVAPFKAQNMSNNSAVTVEGGEIGRAQAMQALACGLAPSVRFNPVLLKPGADNSSQVVLLGQVVGTLTDYRERSYLDTVVSTLDGLRAEFDVVVGRPQPPVGRQWLRVAVVRLPRISNATDVEALACEPGVAVRFVTEPSRLADADLIVLPGSKSTVDDLAWLRARGLADALTTTDKPVLGICGGFQMLGRRLVDHVESGRGEVGGLGLLDLDIEFAAGKTLVSDATGNALGEPVSGYEIHHGQVVRQAVPTLITRQDGSTEGADTERVIGTHWHGLLDNDAFRRRLLTWAAERSGRTGFTVAPDTRVTDARDAQLDVLADLVSRYLDTDALSRLIEQGPNNGLPVLSAGIAE
jgi:adenosylcobyric acid synthase